MTEDLGSGAMIWERWLAMARERRLAKAPEHLVAVARELWLYPSFDQRAALEAGKAKILFVPIKREEDIPASEESMWLRYRAGQSSFVEVISDILKKREEERRSAAILSRKKGKEIAEGPEPQEQSKNLSNTLNRPEEEGSSSAKLVTIDPDAHCEHELVIDIETGFTRGGGGTTHASGDHPESSLQGEVPTRGGGRGGGGGTTRASGDHLSDLQGAVPTRGGGGRNTIHAFIDDLNSGFGAVLAIAGRWIRGYGAARALPRLPAGSDDVLIIIQHQVSGATNEYATISQTLFSAIVPAAAMSYSQMKEYPDHIKLTMFGGLAFTTMALYGGMLSRSNARGRLAMRLASCSLVTLFTFGVASQMSGAKYVIPTAIAGGLMNLFMMLLKI